jgi:hypothetical protein
LDSSIPAVVAENPSGGRAARLQPTQQSAMASLRFIGSPQGWGKCVKLELEHLAPDTGTVSSLKNQYQDRLSTKRSQKPLT